MSYQFINPYIAQQNGLYYPNNMSMQNSVVPAVYAQNPYQASFYNGNAVYPYNQFNIPNLNAAYVSLGQITNEDGKTLHLYQLQNGQKVAILPVQDEATIIKTYVDGGSMNESDRVRGISHTIEHCLFKGSSKLQDGDVFRLTGLMGATTNASTDFAQTDYYILAPFMDKDNLKKSIEIQGDMISNPTFDSNAIESEKNPICSEISMMNDEATTVAYDRVLRNLFQIKSNSQNLVAGSIQTVSDLTRDDIVNHHKTYYTPENLYTVVVGDVDPNETINMIAKNFTIPKSTTNSQNQYKETLTPIQQAVREDIRSSKTNFTTAILAFAGPKPSDSKDFVIYQMLNLYLSTISTSDLKNNLEDLNAEFASSLQKVGLEENDPYAMINVLALNPRDEQKGLDYFYDAIQKLQTTPLSDDDMTALKNLLKKGTQIAMSNSEVLCDVIGDAFLDKSFDLFQGQQGIIDSITKQDIINFTRKYYDLNKASIVVVHPSSVSVEDIKANYNSSKYSLQNLQKNNPRQIAFCGNVKINTDDIEEGVLNNNTHIALNKTDHNLCVFNWSVNTPPIKPKNPNIPMVLGYMFQKGSEYKNQSELERFKELNAITADVFVNGKSIEISADCSPEKAHDTLMLMNELMYSPKLTQNDFETAKRCVKENLMTSSKNASSNLLDNLYPGYFPTEAQMLKRIDELTLDDVKEFYNQLLTSATSAFVATIPEKQYSDIRKQIYQAQNSSNITFKKFVPKLSPLFEANPESKVIYDTDDLNQAQICKTYKFPLSGNIEDEASFELVNTILGASPNARLFSDLREKQNLAYSVSSSIQSFENTGILTLKIQTTTDNPDVEQKSYENVQKSLDGFKKHTDLLCNELVSDEELDAAKMRLKQRLVGQCQNPLDKNDLLAMNILEPYGIKRISKYLEAIDKVTKEDIKKSANFIFSHNPTISILASEDTINSQMDYLKTQGTVYQAAA